MTSVFDDAIAQIRQACHRYEAALGEAFDALTAAIDAALAPPPPVYRWSRVRGINGGDDLGVDRLRELKIGVIRVKPPVEWGPVDKTGRSKPQIDFDAWDRLLDSVEPLGIRVVVDPHTCPGFARPDTTFADDDFWGKLGYRENLAEYWHHTAAHNAGRGAVIGGYELLNEPTAPCQQDGKPYPLDDPRSWQGVVLACRDAIRAVDAKHTIIVGKANRGGAKQGPWMRANEDTANAFVVPDPIGAENICYAFHCYAPSQYTIYGRGTYPGVIDGVVWDAARIAQSLQPLLNWQKANGNPPVFISEFAPIPTAGQDATALLPGAELFLRHELECYEKNGWSWAFHTLNYRRGTFDVAKNPAMLAVLREFWTLPRA